MLRNIIVFIMLIFCAAVVSRDVYLAIYYADLLPEIELNPIGNYLLALTGGNIALFMGVKVFTNLIGAYSMVCLNFLRPRLAFWLISLTTISNAVTLYILEK